MSFFVAFLVLVHSLGSEKSSRSLVRTQNVVITTHGLLLFQPIKLLNIPSPLLSHN